MGSFVTIPVVALLCYLFMGLPLLASKRNKLINAFLWMLLLLIVWSGGSFCMRLQLWPSTKLWYDLSLLGLTLFPCGMLYFICEFAERQSSFFRLLFMFILIPVNIINMFTGFFLAAPEVVKKTVDGDATFVYHPTWAVSILFILCCMVTLQVVLVLVQKKENSKVTRQQSVPIVAGIAVMFLGNFFIMLPQFRTIPLDIASGVIYAMCLFYALYKKRLFRLTLFISRSNCYALSAVISLFLFINLIRPIELFIQTQMPHLIKYQVLISAVFFTCAVQIIYHLMKSFVDRVFVKDEIMQAEHLKHFSLTVSKSLRVDEILDELICVIQSSISVSRVYVCIANMGGQVYTIARSTSSLDQNTFTFQYDNPVIQWLKTNNECLIMKEFRRTTLYKSMWENEKRQLTDLGIECFMPLRDENDLVGIVMMTGKSKNNITNDDINFLSSVEVIASIAVKNSRLYEKAFTEARTDELTGLLNRKCFYETLSEEFEKSKNSSLALMILNMDDFKLYNQLYGNKEGDAALQQVSKIIKTTVGSGGYVARYSGKEFAVILPMYDLLAAKTLAENIREQISNMNKRAADYTLKALTVSVGICGIPYGATTLKQLLDNVDMAVYQVKRNGKNAIMVYSGGQQVVGQKSPSNLVHKEAIYSEFAPTIFALTAAIDTKDHYTFSHSKNVAYYSTELARALGLNEDTVEIIREAALLHDIGKIGISEQILNKPGKLTPEQYEIMKGHVENSIGIIRHLPSLDYVIPGVIAHHERYDGRGYPRRIAGEDIPLSARILCIADSFDAMISKRSYKESFPLDQSLELLNQEAGKQFDPQLVHLFIDLVLAGEIEAQISPQIPLAQPGKQMIV